MKHIETIKSIAVTLLFMLMVVLAALYIVSTQRLTVKSDEGAPLDSLLVIRDSGTVGYDSTMVMPASVAFCENGRMYGCFCDSSVLYDMYAVTSELLTLLLGPMSSASAVQDGDAFWNECAASDNFIYIKYHTQLPAPVIYAGLRGGTLSSAPEYASGDAFNISELFIMPEDTEKSAESAEHRDGKVRWYAVVRDENGNTAKYEVGSDYEADGESFDFTIGRISVFGTGNGVRECGFYFESGEDFGNIKLRSTALMTPHDLALPAITVSSGLSGGMTDGLLRFFDFNPDRLNTYTESDGTTVFVETHGVLRFGADELSYHSSGGIGGIELASLLGYESYSGTYNVYELISAAGELFRRVKSHDVSIGGIAAAQLTDVEYSEGRIKITLGLTYGGVLLYGEDYRPVCALEVTFSEGYLTDAVISLVSVDGYTEMIECFPQSWTLRTLSSRLPELPEITDEGGNGVPVPDTSLGDVRLGYVIGGNYADGSDSDNRNGIAGSWLYLYKNRD